MARLLRKKLALLCLLVYWPSLFVLAHIPIPRVVRQADLSDKTLHVLAYFILVFLLWGAIQPYQRVNWRKAHVWMVLAVVVWYGAVDEWLQGYAGRTPDVKDFAADLIGAGSSLILLTLLSFWPATLVLMGMSIFALANCSRGDITKLVPLTHSVFHALAYGVFTCLWITCIQKICGKVRQYRTRKIVHWLGEPRPPLQGFVLSVLLPFLLLGTVKLGSIALRRPLANSDIIAAACGIITVSCAALSFDILGVCRRIPSSARRRAILSPGKDGEAGDVGFIADTAGCSQAEKGPLEARSSSPTGS
jgi:VanZ family protein